MVSIVFIILTVFIIFVIIIITIITIILIVLIITHHNRNKALELTWKLSMPSFATESCVDSENGQESA